MTPPTCGVTATFCTSSSSSGSIGSTHVTSRPAPASARAQGGEQGVAVDDAAARDVDDVAAGAQGVQRGRADDPARRLGQGAATTRSSQRASAPVRSSTRW